MVELVKKERLSIEERKEILQHIEEQLKEYKKLKQRLEREEAIQK